MLKVYYFYYYYSIKNNIIHFFFSISVNLNINIFAKYTYINTFFLSGCNNFCISMPKKKND